MLIHIMYPGNTYDYVREFMLGNLIETGKIVKFRRANGWVSIGDDLVRDEKLKTPFRGVERRTAAQPMSSPKNGIFQTGVIREHNL